MPTSARYRVLMVESREGEPPAIVRDSFGVHRDSRPYTPEDAQATADYMNERHRRNMDAIQRTYYGHVRLQQRDLRHEP